MAEQVDEILLGFVEEMEGYIPALHEGAGELRAHPDNRPTLDEMRRLVHIVRGAAAMLGVEPLSRVARSMELALDHVREGEAVLNDEVLEALEDTTGIFERYAAHLAENGAEPNPELSGMVDELCERIDALPVIEAPPVNAALVSDMHAMDALDALFGADAPASGESPAASAGIELDDDVLASFNAEVDEHFETINASLLRLGEMATGDMPADEGAREEIRAIRRAVHTVGGASTVLGLWQTADVGHRIVEALDRLAGETAAIGPERMECLALVLDQFETLARRPADFDLAVVEAGLEALNSGTSAAPEEPAPAFAEEESALFADAEEPAPALTDEAPAFTDETPALAEETPAFAVDADGDAVLTLDEDVLAAEETPAFAAETEEPAPALADEPPAFANEAPAFAEETPAFAEEESALFADAEEPAPALTEEAPAFTDETPAFADETPAFAVDADGDAVLTLDEDVLAAEETPAFVVETEEPAPALADEPPAFADEVPAFAEETPAFAGEESALFADAEEPAPALTDETPAFADETPAVATDADGDAVLTLDEDVLAAEETPAFTVEPEEPAPALADETPAFANEVPAFEEETPAFADETPAFATDADGDAVLTLDEDVLASEEAPAFAAEAAEPATAPADETPAFADEVPAFAGETPAFATDADGDALLTLDEDVLAAEEAPAFAAEVDEPATPAFTDETPAFAEEESALFSDVEEPAPASADDMLTLDEDVLAAEEAPALVDEAESDAVLTLDEDVLAAEAEDDTAIAADETEEDETLAPAAIDPDMLDVNELFAADAPAGMVEDQPADDFLATMGTKSAKPEESVHFTDEDAEEMEEELFGASTVDELFPTHQPEVDAADADALLGGDPGSAEDLFGAAPDDAFPDAGFGMADAAFDEPFDAETLAATEPFMAEAEPSAADATPMTAAGFELDDELLEGFKEEADEHFETIEGSLAALGNLVEETVPMNETISEELRAIRRAVHTVKGASAVLGMQHIADVGHRIEDVLDWFYEEAGEIGPEQMATLSLVLDQFENLVRRPDEFDASVVDEGLAELRAGMDDATPKTASATTQPSAPPPAASAETVAVPTEPTMTAAGIELDDELLASFTEEVNEHFETIETSLAALGNLVEETVPMDETISEELRGIRRAVHTVKGASAVLGLQHIADVGHRIEDVLDWFYEEAGEIGPEQMATLSLVLDQFENLVRTPDSYEASVVDEGLAALQAGMGDAAPKAASAPVAPVTPAPVASGGTVAVPTEPTMTAGGFELDEELLASFTEEVNEHFETIAGSLTTLGNLVEETVPMDETIGEELRAVRRAVHTVKGASAVIGLQHIADVGHRIEDVLDWFYEEAGEIGPEQMATLSLVLDQFENLVRTPDSYESSVVDEGLAALHAWMGDAAPAPKTAAAPTPEPAAFAPETAPADAGSMAADLFSEEEQEMLRAGFMEEAAEHLNDVSRVLQSVESKVTGPTPMDAELKEELREIRRSVHTIKGASAVIGLNDISAYAHKVEDYLDWFFEEAESADLDTVGLLAESLDLLHGVVENPASVAEERKQDIYARLNAARGAAPEAAPAPAAPATPVAASVAPAATAWRLEEEEHEPLTEQEIEQLRHSFAEEADLHIASLHQSVQFLSGHISGTAPPPAVLEETGRMYELLLSLRKDARILGNGDVHAFAGMLANFLGWARTGAVAVSPALLDALGDSVDVLDQLLEDPDLVNWERIDDVCDKLETLRKHAIPPEPVPADEPAPAFADIAPALSDMPASPVDLPASPVDLPAAGAAPEPAPEAPKAAADEAAKTIRIHQNQLDRFINLANELLVGVSGFDRNMDRFQDALGELDLAARRLKDIAMELETKFEVKALGEITDHFDRIREEAREISADIRNLAEFDSLELDHYTQLNLIIRALNESAIDVSALQTTLVGIRSGLRGDINRQHRTVRELQVRLMEARLSPMSILTPRLSRTMRDAAARLKKRVRLVTEGDTVELDRLIWEKLADPFMHMVRNSIDHGIESAEERAAKGKPAIATIRVKGEREGNHVMIRFSDDGRGLNLEAIRERARKDLGDEADDLEREQLIDLIFDNGFSVKQEVTQVSGRGVGMDVVKQNILDLQGTITVDTETGRGTEFTIRVPLTLGLVRVLLVDMAGVTYGIPITEIQEVRRVPRADIDMARGSFLRGGEKTPLYDLPQLLLRDDPIEDDHEVGPIIFTILTERGPVGIRIPHITGQREVVIKGLGSHLRAVTGIAGAAVMGDGSVIPLLNMDELLAAFLIQGMPQMIQVRPEAEKPKTLTVMIVDDSISIRRVMSRLVSNHGWIPVECKDGQDAFEKLDSARPDCILLDIEMPRMNGFEFLTLKANLPDHKDIPVIMLTSRSHDKHRNKAFELGASMFLNKPSKDEDLVEAVLGLTGHGDARFVDRQTEVAL